MKSFTAIALPLCAFGAAIVAGPLAAADQPMVVEGQSAYQERVSFADLNLRSWGDQQALRRRVHKASERVCIQAEGPIGYDTGFMGGESCVDSTYADARPQIRGAIASAKSGRLMATGMVISAPARAR